MEMLYCQNCKKTTAHKRSLGFGTLLAVLITGGIWLIAILFYPQRCIACGSDATARNASNLPPFLRVAILLAPTIIMILLVLHFANSHH